MPLVPLVAIFIGVHTQPQLGDLASPPNFLVQRVGPTDCASEGRVAQRRASARPMAPLKVALFPFGSRGDVQPFVPLALALQQAGHDVRLLAIGEATAAWLRAAGVAGVRLVEGFPDVDELIKSSPALMEAMRTGNFAAFNKGRFEALQSSGAALVAGLVGFADEFKPDVALVHAMLNPFGCYLRELGTPVVKLYLQPGVPTALQAPIFFAFLPRLCALLTRLGLAPKLHRLQAKMAQRFFLEPGGHGQQMRARASLPPFTLERFCHFLATADVPVLCAYSPALAPPPADYGAHVHVSGFCTLSVSAQLASFAPDEALRAFLATPTPSEGEGGATRTRPVYMGWGSMIAGGKEHMAALAVGAAMKAGVRAVVLGGWARIGADALPEELRAYAREHVLFCAGSLPHEWLLPQCSCAVIHGGAGTTAAVLRSGVPCVVTPVFVDQFFWAQRVTAMRVGVGFDTTPLLKVSADDVAAAIRACVGPDAAAEAVRRNAAALGEALRAEDGVGAAVKLIEGTAAAATRERWDSAPPPPPPRAADGQRMWLAAAAVAVAAVAVTAYGLRKR